MRTRLMTLLWAFALNVLSACAPSATFVPGLGELMGQVSARHMKLWFAGAAGNWPLAAYELDELRESLEDTGRYHATHRRVPGPVSPLVSKTMVPALNRLEAAIAAGDADAFGAAYDAVSEGCNACHRASGLGFLRLNRPTTNSFSNQSFRP